MTSRPGGYQSSEVPLPLVTSALYVAAGGGGDVIAAAILASIRDTSEPAVIASLAWDRLIIDPIPGPRTFADFTGLRHHGPLAAEITPDTRPIPPAGSLLPRLASELSARLFLLDATNSVPGLADQLTAIAAATGRSRLVLVDVGGDLVAEGTEDTLRSPLADFLLLSACLTSKLPLTALVAGPGLDGELPEADVIARCVLLGAEQRYVLSRQHVQPFRHLFTWHPSEATGLLVAAAAGRRGVVEVRDAGLHVPLTARSPTVYAIPGESFPGTAVLIDKLTLTTSLTEAEAAVRATRGRTEIDYERRKASQRRTAHGPTIYEETELHAMIDLATDAANRRGADFVTIRRLSEILGMSGIQAASLPTSLATYDPRRYDPPLWEVRGPQAVTT